MTATYFPKPTKSDANELPGAMYRVRCKDVQFEERPKFDRPDQMEQRCKFVLEIEDVIEGSAESDDAYDQVGKEQWHWTSVSWGAKAAMRNHVEAFLGRQVDWDEDVDVESVKGKRAIATVDYPTKPNGEKSDRRKITTMAPYRTRKATDGPVAPALAGNAAPAGDAATPGEDDPNDLPF